MESHPSLTDRPTRVPPNVWFLGIGLIAALAAIFIFNVDVNTVAYYGFLAFVIGGHFFMHGSHGGHGGSAGHDHEPESTAVDADKDQDSGHTGGCH